MQEKKRSVLIIDDSPTVRRLAEIVLSNSGYEVYTAADGEEGIKIAKQTKPSIILVDFIMPKMNGYKVCKIIRSDPELKNIPLILITAKGEEVGQTFEEKFGIIHYFQKPFEPDELVTKIDNVLGVEKDSIKESKKELPDDLLESFDKLLRHYFDHELKARVKWIMIEVLKEMKIIKTQGLIFSGEVKYIPIPDLIQFISTSLLSGKLTVVASSLNSEIYFEKGHIVFATVSKPGYRRFLTDLLIEDGRINKNKLREIIKIARNMKLPIGRVMVKQGVITEDELMRYLKQLTEDAIFHTLTVDSGLFFLENSPLPMNLSDIKFRLGVTSLLLDGLRKIDESRIAAEIFSSDELVPMRLITNVEALEEVELEEKETKVFSLIDGKTPLRNIIIKSGMDELEVKRICYSLQKIGLLKIKEGSK